MAGVMTQSGRSRSPYGLFPTLSIAPVAPVPIDNIPVLTVRDKLRILALLITPEKYEN